MTPEQAITILIQAAEIAQKKGAFTLSDAKSIIIAIETLSPKKDKVEETKEEEK